MGQREGWRERERERERRGCSTYEKEQRSLRGYKKCSMDGGKDGGVDVKSVYGRTKRSNVKDGPD